MEALLACRGRIPHVWQRRHWEALLADAAHDGFEIYQGRHEVHDEGAAAVAAPCYHRHCMDGHEDDDGTYLSSWEVVNLFDGDEVEADKGEVSAFLPVRARYHSLLLQ